MTVRTAWPAFSFTLTVSDAKERVGCSSSSWMVSVLVLNSGSTWMLALAATTVMMTVSFISATLSLTIVIGVPSWLWFAETVSVVDVIT